MESRYKITISNKNVYKEIELTAEMKELKVGTSSTCDIRLSKQLFFGAIRLTFVYHNGDWSVLCSDNLYLSVGDVKKLMTKTLVHGDELIIRYQSSDSEAFTMSFMIDFDNGKRRYERAIDLASQKDVSIGTSETCNIMLKSEYVREDRINLSRQEATSGPALLLTVIHSAYGVYHNGKKVEKKAMIQNNDFIYLSDYIFYYKDNKLWTEIREDMVVRTLSYMDYAVKKQYPQFIRNTRIKVLLNTDKIAILDPPAKPVKPKNDLFMRLLPSLGMLVASGSMAFMGGAMVFFGLISGGMSVITAVLGITEDKKDYKRGIVERIEKYNRYIEIKREEIQHCRQLERQTLNEIYLSPEQEQQMFYEFSSDLFDRMPEDEDFLHIRLGTGQITAKRSIDYKKQERLEIEDELQNMPEEVWSECQMLDQAPVICELKNMNALGIIGKEPDRYALLKSIVLDLCTRQFYSDLELVFVANEKNKDKVEWLRFLPHVNNAIGLRNIVYDNDSKNLIFEYLYNVLSNRQTEEKHNKHIIAFFYDELGFNSHPISKFVSQAKELGITFLFFVDRKEDAPLHCDNLINLVNGKEAVLVDAANSALAIPFQYFTITDAAAKNMVRLLAPVYTEEISLEGSLTKKISLFELLGISAVEDLDLSQQWAGTAVYRSMSAPIGISRSGMVNLDLHDKAHGPHGLVAGTTGSGKSEILQTYILSMATLFHPYEVAFVIIDFKGGGMVNQFKNMPHLLGAITNIDGKQINRSLKSIKAELQKRQRLFAEADVNHIDKYIKKYKSKEVSIPLPHLIIIVDEFAELKAEQPDFMKELISAARIGRSLGVHLILATQKPSGQVDDQIWSNSRFKLCLKVQSPEDSNEVLKSPLAAEIKEPGRAYLQVGNNEIFELFQSAFSGAPAKLDGESVKEFTIFKVTTCGQRIPVFIQKKKESDSRNVTQLDSVVQYVTDYCKEQAIEKLPNICLPALSSCITYPDEDNVHKENSHMVEIGIYDDPDNQYQGIAWLDVDNKNTLMIGSSQYGKTNLIQCIIRSIVKGSSPKESVIYIIDFGSMVLKNFENLNHVGGVVCSSEDEKLKNLFKMLHSETALRKEKLAALGLSSYASYLEAGYTDLPHIYLLVDNLTALIELYLEDNDTLLILIREGLAVGISTLVGNSQTTGIGYKYLSNFSNKVALYCNDSNEYSYLYDHMTLQADEIPGRCVIELENRMLECQTYLSFNGEKEIDRVREMHAFVEKINEVNTGMYAKKIPCIPTILTFTQLQQDFNVEVTEYRIPVGLTYTEVSPFYLDISNLGAMGLCGRENSEHKNFIAYMMYCLNENRTKYPVRTFIFDDISRMFADLQSLDIVEQYTLDINKITDIITSMHETLHLRYQEMIESTNPEKVNELLLLVIQNNEATKVISDDMDLMTLYTEIVTKYKHMKVCILFSNYENAIVSYDAPEPLRMVKQEQHLLYFDNLDNLKPFDVPYEIVRENKKKLECQDAYYIQDNTVTKLKMVRI